WSKQRKFAIYCVHQDTELLNASMTVSSKILKMEIVLMGVVVVQNDKSGHVSRKLAIRAVE
ncbi:unnamed protein product, partial [Eruca vesicaria subsp. sativa]|nr:unnamed protein product [Eruca vesicaria subsp. sativa]